MNALVLIAAVWGMAALGVTMVLVSGLALARRREERMRVAVIGRRRMDVMMDRPAGV